MAGFVRRWGIIALVALLAGCTRLFFYPDQREYFSPAQWNLPFREVTLTARDGTALDAWVVPAIGPAKATVLFLHGNAQNMSAHISNVAWMPKRGYNLVLLDYRGYGKSKGAPELDLIFDDIYAALGFIGKDPELNRSPLVVFGQSVGGALAITAVARYQREFAVRALVSDSSFSSYQRIAREKFAALWLTWPLQIPLSLTVADHASPIDVVASLSPIPILIMHGEADGIVPSHHAHALYKRAREPKDLWLFPGMAHTEGLTRPEHRDRLVAWIDAAIGQAR